MNRSTSFTPFWEFTQHQGLFEVNDMTIKYIVIKIQDLFEIQPNGLMKSIIIKLKMDDYVRENTVLFYLVVLKHSNNLKLPTTFI